MTTIYDPKPVAATTYTSDKWTGGSMPASFDAFLYKSINSEGYIDQLKLTIKLRLKLRKLESKPDDAITLDSDDVPFWTSPWTAADWQRFIRGAAVQADMWNNKFWLTPTPEIFSKFEFDKVAPGGVYRPNIRCELAVDFEPTVAPHKTIAVANLDTTQLLGQTLSGNTFRSHSVLWDSLDTVPWLCPYGPGPTETVTHNSIAHEIGHAIGLGHIGTILKTRLCEIAIEAQSAGTDDLFPDTKGGRNSNYCYGYDQGIAIAGNMMGNGSSFRVENAGPWLWAFAKMCPPGVLSDWQVVMSDPGPASWVRLVHKNYKLSSWP